MVAIPASFVALLLALQPPGEAPSADAASARTNDDATSPDGSEAAAGEVAEPGAAASPDRAPAPAPSAITPPALVTAPTLVNPLPVDEARALGPATVIVLVTVGEDGSVQDASVVEDGSHEDGRLRDAALAAVHETRFTPAMRDGAPLVVRLPFELTFQPPPPAAPPLLEGLSLDVAAPAGDADRPALDLPALGQSLLVGGALMAGAGLLFTTFSGVTALDNATRQDELAKTADERSAAETTRAYGTALLIPVAGPFLALPSSPDASSALFTALGGATHVAGLALLLTGGALALSPLWLGDEEPQTAAE